MASVIDVGSNSVRLLVADISCGRVEPVFQTLRTTRLAAGGKLLPPQNIQATVDAIAEMQQICRRYGDDTPLLLATSAVRDAVNSDELIEAVKQRSGLNMQVISGEQEAEYSFSGAAACLADPQRAAVIDIGGASTEVVWRQDGALCAHSYQLGAVRARKNGWDRAKIAEIIAYYDLSAACGRPLVGVGGTITTAAAVILGLKTYSREGVQGKYLTKEQLRRLLDDLLPLSDVLRCAYSPFLAQRGDIMEQGLNILLALLQTLNSDGLTVSDAGLTDGILLKQACV